MSSDPPPLAIFISGPGIELQPLINRCLKKDPEARYQDIESLLKDLRELERRIGLLQQVGHSQEQVEPVEPERAAVPVRRSLLVIYFENLSGDPEFEWWRKALMELLSLRLMSNQQLDVVSGEQLAGILAQLGHNGNGEIDKALAWEISRRSGAEICLLGSFLALGAISLSAHLHDVSTGRPVASLTARRAEPGELFAIIDEIAAGIERELRVAREDLEPAETAKLATGSLDALRAFAAGLECYYGADFTAAGEQFERALEADPRFALASGYLGRVGERTRLITELEEAAAGRDLAAQQQLAEEFILKFPCEKSGYLFLGESNRRRGECERAATAFEQALALDPWLLLQDGGKGASPSFESLLDAGRFELAEELAGRLSTADPQNWFACHLLGIALFYSQRYEEARAAFALASALDGSQSVYPGLWQARIRIMEGDFVGAEWQLCTLGEERSGPERSLCRRDLADLLRERGRLRDWLELVTEEQEQFGPETDLDPSFLSLFPRSCFFEQIGETEQALEDCRLRIADCGLTKDNPQSAIHNPQSVVFASVHLGRLRAACGHYDSALELAEQVGLAGRKMKNPLIERLSLFLYGAIEFYQGDYESAAKLLERSIWSYYNGFALAIRMLSQSLRRLGRYERSLELLDWIQPYGTASEWSRYSTRAELDLEIAKTYEAAGAREPAVDFYARCMQAWGSADADFVGRLEAETGLHYLSR